MSAQAVVVRRARAGDAAARGAVLRDAYSSLVADSFLYFYFHETTLQGVVLCGAALFIFGGCGARALLALPAGAALLVLCAAAAAQAAAAERAAARLPRELAGWVAERRGPPRATAAPPDAIQIVVEPDAKPAPGGQLVGTVSVWRPARPVRAVRAVRGVLGGLGVARAWRRRGLARALLAAAAAAPAAAPAPAPAPAPAAAPLVARVSALQPAARALLHEAGWSVAGVYAAPLLGAYWLPLAALESAAPAGA